MVELSVHTNYTAMVVNISFSPVCVVKLWNIVMSTMFVVGTLAFFFFFLILFQYGNER
jgi:hypothetical protein